MYTHDPATHFLSRFIVPLTERRLTNATKKVKRKHVNKNPPVKNIPPEKIFSGECFGNVLNFVSVCSNCPCRETPENALKKRKRR
jgi:hypothetical protein